MWLIVGLGNPGRKYARTRHSLGARVVETLRQELGQPALRTQKSFEARVSFGSVILALPTTFMNASGMAVASLVQKYRIPLDRLLIVHDDKDLAFGTVRLQRNRSAAGHRGVQSVIDALGSKAFWRLRVGIGAPPDGVETDTFVLQPFAKDEEQTLADTVIPEALARLVSCIQGQ